MQERTNGQKGTFHRLRPWLIAAGGVVLVVLGLWWAGAWPFGGEGDAAASGQGPRRGNPVSVSVVVAQPEEIPVYYEYNGLTRASRQADIRPRVSGTVERVAFAEGQAVAEGELLYRLDGGLFQARLEQAQAERQALQASLAFAEAQVARFAELADDGYATGERYDEVLARREELEGRLAAVEARISAARTNLDYTEIRAPFAGRVGISRLDEGDLASPNGQPLTTLVRLDPIEVRFEVRDDDLPRIRRALAGDQPVRTVALLSDDAAYADYGTLEALDNAVDATTGTMTAIARFPNPNELLSPGRFVDVRVLLGRTQAILVPAAALSANLDRRIVYRVGPEGTAQPVPVQIGRQVEGRVVVVEGLKAGEHIVTSNLQAVRAGVPLQVPDPPPEAAPAPVKEAASTPDGGRQRTEPLAPTTRQPPRPAVAADAGPDPANGAASAGQSTGSQGARSVPLVGARPSGIEVPSGTPTGAGTR